MTIKYRAGAKNRTVVRALPSSRSRPEFVINVVLVAQHSRPDRAITAVAGGAQGRSVAWSPTHQPTPTKG